MSDEVSPGLRGVMDAEGAIPLAGGLHWKFFTGESRLPQATLSYWCCHHSGEVGGATGSSAALVHQSGGQTAAALITLMH